MNSHGKPSGSGSAPPVLDVAPLRAIPPMCPPPAPPGCAPFIYVSPFSPFASQFTAAGGVSPMNPPAFDPVEAQRKLEQEIASKEKRARRSAVRNYLRNCGKTTSSIDNSAGNGSVSNGPLSNDPVSNAEQPLENNVICLDAQKKTTRVNQSVPKSEVFDHEDTVTMAAPIAEQDVPRSELSGQEDGFTPTQNPKISKTPKTPRTPKIPGSAKGKNLGEEETSIGIESSNGKKRRKRSESRAKGTTVFRSPEGGEGQTSAALDRKMVRRALIIYDSLRRKLVQDDEACKEVSVSGSCKRPDLKAGTIMMDRGLCVNRDRRIIGSVPGVDVGDLFYFRMELCVIGLHGPVMAGIDYINARFNEWSEPVATSIISSGGYEDNEDDGETLIYTGQGGNNYMTDKKQTNDQKLERGNLALERSMHHGIQIRVIRGMKDGASPSGKTYFYDGLYMVQESWLDKGRSGFSVFKYKLQRIQGQPELGSALLRATRQWKSQPSARQGLLLSDMSLKNENIPVCLVNNIDDDKGPGFFEYIRKVRYSHSVGKLEPSQGCDCKSGCVPGENCSCISLNGGEMPYNSNGYLVKWKHIVYECSDHCRCPTSCRNRVSQKGLKNHLEVFKTHDRGWGVRSWDPIPAGSFVCEYTGELFSDSDTEEEDEDNDYLLHANHMQRNQIDCTGASDILYGGAPNTAVRFHIAIDASRMGNVSRFMNHSCSPNLFHQAVVYDYHDTQFPHIMLFAIENIPPLRELTFDYGASHNRKSGKNKACLCGASDCRGKFF